MLGGGAGGLYSRDCSLFDAITVVKAKGGRTGRCSPLKSR